MILIKRNNFRKREKERERERDRSFSGDFFNCKGHSGGTRKALEECSGN